MAKASSYLHGFTKTEQKRLLEQAKFLETSVYAGIDFKKCKHIIEVGCGVGAQTAILLKRFPHLKITGIDFSHQQLAVAKKRLRSYVKSGQVQFIQMDATQLSKLKQKYDGAFICWFLEHVPEPTKVLKAIRSILKNKAVIYCTEVQNSSLFVEPYSPSVLKYWYEFNDFQWCQGQHPFIGTSLGHLLKKAGFKNILTESRMCLVDSRNEKQRKAYFRYYSKLFLSAAPQLIETNKISKKLANLVKKEMASHTRSKAAILFDTWMRAKAYR